MTIVFENKRPHLKKRLSLKQNPLKVFKLDHDWSWFVHHLRLIYNESMCLKSRSKIAVLKLRCFLK